MKIENMKMPCFDIVMKAPTTLEAMEKRIKFMKRMI